MICARQQLLKAFFCFAALLMAALGRAEEWTIPLAGNAYRTDPSGDGLEVENDDSISWTDAEAIVSVYFHVNQPASLDLALVASSPDGSSMIKARFGKQSFRKELQSAEPSKKKLGRIEVKQAGYVRIDLQGDPRQGKRFAKLESMVVDSKAKGLKLDFVKSNEGNMFYWGRRGPSVHLTYPLPDKSVQFAYSEITVPEGQDPIGTYYMANGFGEGYFGMQVNGPQERRVLFSVWSPFSTDNPKDIPADQRIVKLGQGPDVHIGEFGNEGSGGQSYLVYPWKAGQTYRFLTEVKPDQQGNSIYTAWFGEPNSKTWRLIASFQRPKTNTYLRGFHSFLESFSPTTGYLERSAKYGNVWVRDIDGEWHECNSAKLSVDATGSGRHRLDFTGGSTGDHFYLRNCGFFSETGVPGSMFERQSTEGLQPQIDVDSLPR